MAELRHITTSEDVDAIRSLHLEHVSLMTGVFDVIHPGHVRLLSLARARGKVSVVILFSKIEGRFSLQDRAGGLLALDTVDYVLIVSDEQLNDLVKAISLDALLVGDTVDQKNPSFKELIDLATTQGARLEQFPGEIHYASNSLKLRDYDDERESRMAQFRKVCVKHRVSEERLLEIIDDFERVKVLVVGDVIVDRYVACDAVGMSSEAPVLVVQELDAQDFLGGASIVAAHLAAMGSKSSFVSILGNDEQNSFVKSQLDLLGVAHYLKTDRSRPTTLKQRFIVESTKLLRVSRLKEHLIDFESELQLIEQIQALSIDVDGILMSDFGYGVITPNIIEAVRKIGLQTGKLLAADAQCSSQISLINRYKDFDLLTPTERELRIALADNQSSLEAVSKKLMHSVNAKNMLVTLGSQGFLAYASSDSLSTSTDDREHFIALNPSPVDTAGAGDSLLSSAFLALCAGASLIEASVLGAVTADISVDRIGNRSISRDEMIRAIQHINI